MTGSSEMITERPARSGRVMGLDFGSKTVGVAVSDALLLTAQGVEIIRRQSENKLRRTLARITELAGQYEVTEIVLGLPRNMNYTVGDRALRTVEFREMLIRRTGLPVILWDERLTTVAADRLMMETGIRRENRKEYVDEIAAMLADPPGISGQTVFRTAASGSGSGRAPGSVQTESRGGIRRRKRFG